MTKHKKIKKNIKRNFFEILIILLAFLIINNQDKIKNLFNQNNNQNQNDYINTNNDLLKVEKYIRETLKDKEGLLKELEEYALEYNVPIVHKEVSDLLKVLLKVVFKVSTSFPSFLNLKISSLSSSNLPLAYWRIKVSSTTFIG